MAEARQDSSNLSTELMAKVLCLTSRRVQQLSADGTLPFKDTPDGRRYDLIPTVQAYIGFLKASASNRGGEKESKLREQKMKADIALKESQGELHRLRTDIAAGRYISIEEVKADYQRFFSYFKRFSMGLPPRIISLVSMEPAEKRRLEQELTSEVKSALNQFVVAGTTPEELNKHARKKKDKEISGDPVPD